MLAEKKVLISVIVPIYKVEPYLRCCIDSILAQTFRDFALILVDDGSPDNCGAICDEYAAKDDRIVVIHQENGGLSAARNTGLDWMFANSNSEWITFVDSDDYIPTRYLQQLYEIAKRKKAGIVCSLASCFSDDKEIKNISDEVYGSTLMLGRDACKSILTVDEKISVTAWGKLYKSELFKKARFPEGKIHEDEALIPLVVYNADKVVVLRAWMYGYRNNAEGIMRSEFSLKRFDFLFAVDRCIEYFRKCQDEELVMLAKKHKNGHWAEDVTKAKRAGIYHMLPEEYKLPFWKVYWFLLCDTISRGGIKFVFRRIGNLLRLIKNK